MLTSLMAVTNKQQRRKGNKNMAYLKTWKPTPRSNEKARMLVAESAVDLFNWIKERHDFNNSCASQDSNHKPEQSWDMSAGWSGAVDMVNRGWNEGTKDVLARLDQVKHSLEEQFTGYRMEVTGQFFDVGLVVSGEPECWFQEETEPIRKVAKIAVNATASCGTSANLIRNRGAAIVALADHLQQVGWIVELSVFFVALGHANRDNNENTIIRIDVPTRPVDIDELAFLVAHPAGFRRLGFAAEEAVNCNQNLGGYGGGGILKGDAEYKGEIKPEHSQAFIDWCKDGGCSADANIELLEYLTSSQDDKFGTPELAARWVKEQIEKIG